MVQQLRTLQPERQILPESAAQAAPPEEAGHLLEVLARPLLPSEEQRDDDRSRCRPKTFLKFAVTETVDIGFYFLRLAFLLLLRALLGQRFPVPW